MRMMRYFSSQEVPQLEDGCRSHRQATYVTWRGWSARMEVTFLHNDKAFRKPNAMHGYFLKWYDLGKILSWLSLWQRGHGSCRLLPKCLLQTKRTCHWGSFQLSSMMDSYIAFLTPTPGWPTPTPSSFHTLIHPHWHTPTPNTAPGWPGEARKSLECRNFQILHRPLPFTIRPRQVPDDVERNMDSDLNWKDTWC